MAKQKITSRTAAGDLTGEEVVPVVRLGTPNLNMKTTTHAIAGLALGTTVIEAADATLDGASGTAYTNTGAGAAVTYTLPDSAVDTVIRITADPAEGEVIYLYTVAGISAVVGSDAVTITDAALGYIAAGASVTFQKLNATEWVAISVVGTVGLD